MPGASRLLVSEILMRKVDISEAKTKLSQLIKAAESGEKVLITRAGRPAALLVRARIERTGIRIGGGKGFFKRVAREFDKPMTPSV
jgi:prevent-host-death family protein